MSAPRSPLARLSRARASVGGLIASGLVVALMVGLAVAAWRLAPEDPDALRGSGRYADHEVIQPLQGHRGSPAAATWTPWPQAGRDAQRSGAAEVRGPRRGEVRWSRTLEGNVTPGPVVMKDGTVLVASNAGILHALDPETGKDRWTLDGGGGYGLDLSTSPAVLPSGLILWPGPHGDLIAVTAAGRELWRLTLAGLVGSPAALADGRVAVGDSAGTVLELRPTETGPGVQWRVELDEHSYGSPAYADDGRTVFQSVDSGVVAVRDGRLLWRSEAPTELVEVSPAVGPDGTVVVGTNDPFEYGLDPQDGSVRWRYRRDEWTYSSPVVTRDGIAYFGDHANRIVGVDVSTGERVFGFAGSRADHGPGGVGIWTSIVVDADHTVFAGTRQGLVYAVRRDGRLLWQLELGATVDSYPALTGDGVLVVGVTDGRVLAIGD